MMLLLRSWGAAVVWVWTFWMWLALNAANPGVHGFVLRSPQTSPFAMLLSTPRPYSILSSSIVEEPVSTSSNEIQQQALLDTVKRIKDQFGVIVIDKQAKQDLQEAVTALEATWEAPASTEALEQALLGNWTLMCTTDTKAAGVDTQSLFPFASQDPIKSIRDSIQHAANKYWLIAQNIRSTVEGTTAVNRIDHVLEFQPPEQLQDVLDNLPPQLSTLNINPLHVSKSKLTLVHDAAVVLSSSTDPTSRRIPKVELKLKSLVWNIAGTSTFLDPQGQDVAGLNVPPLPSFVSDWGSSTQPAYFETTYLDDTIRISRSTWAGGRLQPLRVFVRATAPVTEDDATSTTTASSVDPEVVDPTTDNDDSPSDVEWAE